MTFEFRVGSRVVITDSDDAEIYEDSAIDSDRVCLKTLRLDAPDCKPGTTFWAAANQLKRPNDNQLFHSIFNS